MNKVILKNKLINSLMEYLNKNEHIWRGDFLKFKKWHQIWVYANKINDLTEYFNNFDYDIEKLNNNNEKYIEFILNIQLLKDIIMFFSNVFKLDINEQAKIQYFKNILIYKNNKVQELITNEKSNNDNKIFSFLRASLVAHRPKIKYMKSRDWIMAEDEFLVNTDYYFVKKTDALLALLLKQNINNCIVAEFLVCKCEDVSEPKTLTFYFSFDSYIGYIKSLYTYIKIIKIKIEEKIEAWKNEKKLLKISVHDKDLLTKLELIKEKLNECKLSFSLIDKFIYMFSLRQNSNKINKKYINEFLEWVNAFLIEFSRKLEKTIDYDDIEKFVEKYKEQIFGFPNIDINGQRSHLSYCYEKINNYIYKNERTIKDINKLNFNACNSCNEEWGLRCLYIFYKYFANQYVYMDLNNMSFNELFLLVYVAMFKYKQEVKNV